MFLTSAFSLPAVWIKPAGLLLIASFLFPACVSGCTFSLDRTGINLPDAPPRASATDYAEEIFVTTQSGCAWSATSDSSWLTVVNTSASQSGSGVVAFWYTPNISGGPRTATLAVAGMTVSVMQSASNVAHLDPALAGSNLAPVLPAQTDFTWDAVNGASAYWLDVGPAPRRGVYFGANVGAANSQSVSIPADGNPVYVTLWSDLSTGWVPVDYIFTASGGSAVRAALISPTPGSIVSSTATFTWNASPNASDYWLDVGTSLSHGDIYAAAQGAGTTSRTLDNLPSGGGTLYVRLWTKVGANWQAPFDYQFQECASGCNGQTATLMSPVNGAALTASSQTFTWSPVANADNYWLDIGVNGVGSGDLYRASQPAGSTSYTMNGLPTDGRTVYLRLWTHINGAWQTPYDYQFTSCHGCSAGVQGDPRAVLVSPFQNSQFTSGVATFTWTAGLGADAYWLDVGTTYGHGDISSGTLPAGTLSKTVTNLPLGDGQIFVQLFTHINGAWQTPLEYTFTPCSDRCGGGNPQLLTPLPSETLPYSSEVFSWSPVLDSVTGIYSLQIGSTPGGSDIFQQNVAATTTAQAISMPTDGRTVYIRTYSGSSAQLFSQIQVKACNGCGSDPRATLISPTPGSVIGPGTTFTWSGGTGAQQYWLDVGTAPRVGDVSAGAQPGTARTVANIPNDGRLVYVQLWTSINGAWVEPISYGFRTR